MLECLENISPLAFLQLVYCVFRNQDRHSGIRVSPVLHGHRFVWLSQLMLSSFPTSNSFFSMLDYPVKAVSVVLRRWTWTGDFKCREVKTGFCRKRWTRTGSSGTLIGWKSGQTTFIPLWDRMEGAWLYTLETTKKMLMLELVRYWNKWTKSELECFGCRNTEAGVISLGADQSDDSLQ